MSLNFNGSGVPTSFNDSSQSPYLDLYAATPANDNVFIEEFGGTPFSDTGGTYYSTIHGFAQTAGAWPAYTATFNVLTPLYFADGTSVAATPAPNGTYLDIFDRWAGNPQPDTNPHPGASFGDVFVTGKTSFLSGFGVSLYDSHELEKDLYIGSGPTYGEYGFAYNITVHFANGTTLITSPLVDVFAISDPSTGNFAGNASAVQQDNASSALYRAAMADVNGDGIINAQDLALVSSNWLQKGSIGQLAGDANRDGIVNSQDLALISSTWEPGMLLSTSVAVPEPGTVSLSLVAALGILTITTLRRSMQV